MLILSTDVVNERSGPSSLSSTASRPGPPLLVRVRCAVVAVTDQIRAVAKERLDKRMGELSPEHLKAVEAGLREILELR